MQDNKIRKTFYIHNIIFNKTDPNNVVDHINHNPLDNRKCNLRELSKYDNSQNLTIKSKNSLKQKCIYYECNKYRVRIKRGTYGYFERLDDAISIIDEIYPKVYSTYSNQEER